MFYSSTFTVDITNLLGMIRFSKNYKTIKKGIFTCPGNGKFWIPWMDVKRRTFWL